MKRLRNFPALARWLRRASLFDTLLPWCEDQARAAWRGVVGWLLEAQARAPRCLPRPPLQPAFEALETRMLPTTVSLGSPYYTVGEKDGSAVIDVNLDAYPSSTVTVDYATADGTAHAGRDYTDTHGTLTFTTSDLTKTLSVPIIDLGSSGPDVALDVSISNPTGAFLGSTTDATLTISNGYFPLPNANSGPWGLTAGPDGNLWFAEKDANKVAKITPAGTITEYGLPTGNAQPENVVAGPDGNLWFTEYEAEKIAKVTTAGTVTEYGGLNSLPYDIALGPDDNLWFTEDSADIVGNITTSGTVTEFSLAVSVSRTKLASQFFPN
jgi:virginiamycin B lyase